MLAVGLVIAGSETVLYITTVTADTELIVVATKPSVTDSASAIVTTTAVDAAVERTALVGGDFNIGSVAAYWA
jgi:hypothetical protein